MIQNDNGLREVKKKNGNVTGDEISHFDQRNAVSLFGFRDKVISDRTINFLNDEIYTNSICIRVSLRKKKKEHLQSAVVYRRNFLAPRSPPRPEKSDARARARERKVAGISTGSPFGARR